MNRRSFLPWRLAAVAFLLGAGHLPVASGADDASPVAGSCDHPATGNCDEWTGPSWTAAKMERLCASQKGTFRAGGCPAQGQVGACLRGKGKADESRFVYYASYPGYGVKLTPEKVVAAAEQQCTRTMKGIWIPK